MKLKLMTEIRNFINNSSKNILKINFDNVIIIS